MIRVFLLARASLVVLPLAAATAFAQVALVETTPPARDAVLPPAWQSLFDKLTFYGDFRIRAEGDWNRPDSPPSSVPADDRWRARLRLRLGANYSVSDDLLIGTRLSTGNPDDPRDTNATLGDGFNTIEINLDRLFMTWTPESYDPFFLTLGKFGHSFNRNPVYEELVWYSDVQPEGAVMGSNWRDVGPLDLLRAQAGVYIYREESRGDVDIALAEVVAKSVLSDHSRASLSAAWYGYSNADRVAASTVEDYQILDAIAALTIDGDGAPWKFSAEGIANIAVSTPNDTGWAVGVSWGETRKQGDWRAYYQYQEIGNDAVFSPVAGADFLLDHNFRGHVFNADYRLTDKSTLRLRILQATPIDPSLSAGFDEDTLRVRLEYSVKF